MEDSLINDLFYLKELILESDFMIKLVNSEKEMLADLECQRLFVIFKSLNEEYQVNSNDLQLIKRLSDFKVTMYENKKIKEYQENLLICNNNLDTIAKIVFGNIVDNLSINQETLL